jgi:serine-type D-Ala-D-Ala carboxypeptidase (penicillin-binding protein 5/6)
MDNTNTYDKSELKFIAFLIGVLFIFFAISYYLGPKPQTSTEEVVSAESTPSPFENLEIRASAAYVYDIRNQEVLYAKKEDMRLPLASLTKVMASLVASDIAPLETTVAITDDALDVQGESGLKEGERWSLKSLLDFTLTTSSNDGMTAVALALGALDNSDASVGERKNDFVRQMNKKAEELGMNNTYYWNVTGLDESNVKGGAYGSARDMAILFDYILRTYPNLLEATREPEVRVSSLDRIVHEGSNTGLAVTGLPGVKASKTGYTSIAGGNLVIVFDPEIGRPIIISVLNSTYSDRFKDVLTLAEAAKLYVQGDVKEKLADTRE